MKKQSTAEKSGRPPRERRKPKMWEAVFPLAAMVIVLVFGCILNNYPIEILLLLVAAISSIVAYRVGLSWEDLEDEIGNQMKDTMGATLILLTVGVMVAAWMLSGSIPMMIYYGVKLINPRFLLVTAFVTCALVSVITGTSWGSMGTMGVAIMGIAATTGVSAAAAAGAVVSGCYFGDKMSPMSDTTNLAAMSSGTRLYDHIGSMCYTTGPASLLCIIVYGVAGFSGAAIDSSVTAEVVNEMLGQLSDIFNFNILLLVPILIVLGGTLLKLPSTPVMLASSGVAAVEAMLFQHATVGDLFNGMLNGYKISMIHTPGYTEETITPQIQKLLVRGGLWSMMEMVQLMIIAIAFASIIIRSGCMDILIDKLLKVVKSDAGLIATTLASVVIIGITTSQVYLSILLPGQMFRDAYKRRGIDSSVLSRCLEDAGTCVHPIIPWTSNGVYCVGTLGVSTLQFLPWAVLCYSCIPIALVWAFTGKCVKKLREEPGADASEPAAANE